MSIFRKIKPIDIVKKYNRYGMILQDCSEKSQQTFFHNARHMGIANRYFDNADFECEDFIRNAIYNGSIFLCFYNNTNTVGIYIFRDFNMAREFINKNEIYLKNIKSDVQDCVQDNAQEDRHI